MRRKKIRVAAFGLAVFAAMLAWGITGSAAAKNYKTQVRELRERALLQACEYFDSMQVALQKTGCAASPAMLSALSAQLRTASDGAKAALTSLSSGETQLYNMYKLLSQVGAYTQSLSARASAGEPPSEEDRHTLRELYGYAKSLSAQFSYMAGLLDAGLFSFEELKTALSAADDGTAELVSYLGASADAEDSVKDFPTLIYDGPYSDHITEKTSALLGGLEAVSETQARFAAAKAMGVSESLLVADSPAAGRLPVYTFYKDGARAAVTVNGGLPAWLLSDYTAGEAKLSRKEALAKAAEYLQKIGYTNMEPTYSADENGVCIANFACREGDYLCYPDLIKVGVSLSDGRVVSFDARDYLMNHVTREPPAEALTPAEAAAKAAPGLTVKRVSRAVIPTGGGYENYAYELRCASSDGQDVLVYIDTATGQEDDILLLLYADGGTLTK